MRVQKLVQDAGAWRDLGVVVGLEPEGAVAKLSRGPGVYRTRQVEADPWHFFYVDEAGSVVDSGAFSRV